MSYLDVGLPYFLPMLVEERIKRRDAQHFTRRQPSLKELRLSLPLQQAERF